MIPSVESELVLSWQRKSDALALIINRLTNQKGNENIIQSISSHAPHFRIFNQHICSFYQVMGNFQIFGLFQVKRDAAFVTIDTQVIGTLPIQPGRLPLTCIISIKSERVFSRAREDC